VRLTLFGRADCHLCEDMLRGLAPLAVELGFSVDHVDVDSDSALQARYGDKVPVLADPEGREICHGRLDLEALRRRLAVE